MFSQTSRAQHQSDIKGRKAVDQAGNEDGKETHLLAVASTSSVPQTDTATCRFLPFNFRINQKSRRQIANARNSPR